MNKLYSEYKECRKEYIEFLHRLTYFIKKHNLKSSSEIYMVYQYLLENGYLSKNKKFISKNQFLTKLFKDIDLKTLTGAKVFTGNTSKESINSFLIDLENTCGNTTKSLTVSEIGSKTKSNIVVSREKNRLTGFSPANREIYNMISTDTSIIAAAQFKLSESKKSISYKMKDKTNFSKCASLKENQNCEFLFDNQISSTNISEENISQSCKKIEDIDKKQLDQFYKDNNELIEDISNSINNISSSISLGKVKKLCTPLTSYN